MKKKLIYIIFTYPLVLPFFREIQLDRKIFLWLVLTFGLIMGRGMVAQTKQVDSLKQVLQTAREDTNKVKILLRLSKKLYLTGSYDTSLLYADQGLILSKKIGYKIYIANAYNSLGNIYWLRGNYPASLKNHLASLKIREEIGDKKGIAICYNNIGILYRAQDNYPEALKNHFASLKIKEEMGDKEGIASSYNNIGVIYSSQGNYTEALKDFFASLKITEEIGDKKGITNSYTNLGDIYINLGNYTEALKNNYAALKIEEEIGDKEGIEISFANLCIAYTKLKNYALAEQYGKKSLKLATEIGDLDGIKEANQNLSEVYVAIGKPKEALEAYKAYIITKDSLLNEENTKKIVQQQMQFEFDKKETASKLEQNNKDIVAAAESRKQRVILIGVSILLVLILAFSLFIYRSYKLKQRSNIRLEIQKKNIDDSIRYAQRIQQAILPVDLFHANEVREHFLYYQPKDIVSGDFYWRHRIGNELFFAAIDCTGHGVPGAMMSMLGYDLLEYALKDKELREPADILNLMNKQIIQKLNSGNDKTATDGMDMTLCRLNLNTKELVYAGAKNDLYICSKNELELLPVTKYSIGYEAEHVFTQSAVQLQSGDMLWLFTDGYCDQKGGPEGKKFMRTRWKELLKNISALSSAEQKQQLITTFDTWKGTHSQRDDILVMGLRF
jgi:serine phosphatase RsbU (regulator of sigma subunit)